MKVVYAGKYMIGFSVEGERCSAIIKDTQTGDETLRYEDDCSCADRIRAFEKKICQLAINGDV